MIKSVKVTNYLNESVTLDLANPEESGLYVGPIEGHCEKASASQVKNWVEALI